MTGTEQQIADYGYNPFLGVEQFYGKDASLPSDKTAPITRWMRDQTGIHMVDVRLPDGHVIRSVSGETADIYIARGGYILPDGGAS